MTTISFSLSFFMSMFLLIFSFFLLHFSLSFSSRFHFYFFIISEMSRNKRFCQKFEMFISLIVYFKTFSMYESYFAHFKESFLENGMYEKFWKISIYSCQRDLSVESSSLQFALLQVTKSPLRTHFWCTESRFSHFHPRFWRTV